MAAVFFKFSLICLFLFAFIGGLEAITVKDKFAQQVGGAAAAAGSGGIELKSVATVGGESVKPRSGDVTGHVLFDENGAAFPINPIPSTGNIINTDHL